MTSITTDSTTIADWTKDTNGIQKHNFFSEVNPLNAECKQVWINLRIKIENRSIQAGNLWMYAVDFCAREGGSGSDPGFPADQVVKIVPYPDKNGCGGPNDLPCTAELKQPEIFFRMKNIMVAFITEEHQWYKTLQKQSKDVPVLKWWKDMDNKYLKLTRNQMLKAQNMFQSLRWSENNPLETHIAKLQELYDVHCNNNMMEPSWEDFWDQFQLSVMDTEI